MRYPTMTSLRVIVTLAQHGTATAAAQALNMTQSAVSKQLKALETLTGQPMFRRGRRGLEPTQAGLIYIEQGRIVIGAVETAAARCAGLGSPRPAVRLHVLPILGDRWLMPRLTAFADLHPDIEVRHVTYAPRERDDEADIVFRFGEGCWPGWDADDLIGRDVILIGSPAALERGPAIGSINDVLRHRLLEHRQTPLRWDDFFASYEAPSPEVGARAPFGYYSLVIRGAIAGHGLALAPRALVARELETGELINPIGLGFESRNRYWLTTPTERPRQGAVKTFCDWALDQARQTEPRAVELPGVGETPPIRKV